MTNKFGVRFGVRLFRSIFKLEALRVQQQGCGGLDVAVVIFFCFFFRKTGFNTTGAGRENIYIVLISKKSLLDYLGLYGL